MVLVYHIRSVKAGHDRKVNEGYIGVTTDFERRKCEHFRQLKKGTHSNHKLQAYFDSHDDTQMVVYHQAVTEEEAYELESCLRPIPNVALNIAVGGQVEFDGRFNEKIYNVVTDNGFPESWLSEKEKGASQLSAKKPKLKFETKPIPAVVPRTVKVEKRDGKTVLVQTNTAPQKKKSLLSQIVGLFS